MDEPDNEVDKKENGVDEKDNEVDEKDNGVDEKDNEMDKKDSEVDGKDNEDNGIENEVGEMADSSVDFDLTRIWVKFLDDWYLVIIDWNDSRQYKQEQVIQRLSGITGIPIELTLSLTLHELRPRDRVIEDRNDIRCLRIYNNILYQICPVKGWICPNTFTKETMLGPCIVEDDYFYLAYTITFDQHFLKRTAINYELVPQVEVVEGECNLHMCQTACTEPFFNRIKKILFNRELNKELTLRILAILTDDELEDDWEEEMLNVYLEYNILQFFDVVCSFRFSEENLSDESEDEDQNIIL